MGIQRVKNWVDATLGGKKHNENSAKNEEKGKILNTRCLHTWPPFCMWHVWQGGVTPHPRWEKGGRQWLSNLTKSHSSQIWTGSCRCQTTCSFHSASPCTVPVPLKASRRKTVENHRSGEKEQAEQGQDGEQARRVCAQRGESTHFTLACSLQSFPNVCP